MSGFINQDKIPLKAILIGVIGAIIVMLILLCVISALFTYSFAMPEKTLSYIVLIADAAGAFCGAYLCAAVSKSRGLLLGLICGFILFVILFLAGLCSGGSISTLTLIRFVVLMLCGAAGGVTGVNKKERLHIK